MKRMSFWLTRDQMYDRTKDVTRRDDDTWQDLKVGDVVMAIEKGQGLKKGDKQVEIGPIKVLSIRREPLSKIADYPPDEVGREGFPELDAEAFIQMYLDLNGGTPDKRVKRIQFEHVRLPVQLELF